MQCPEWLQQQGDGEEGAVGSQLLETRQELMAATWASGRGWAGGDPQPGLFRDEATGDRSPVHVKSVTLSTQSTTCDLDAACAFSEVVVLSLHHDVTRSLHSEPAACGHGRPTLSGFFLTGPFSSASPVSNLCCPAPHPCPSLSRYNTECSLAREGRPSQSRVLSSHHSVTCSTKAIGQWSSSPSCCQTSGYSSPPSHWIQVNALSF